MEFLSKQKIGLIRSLKRKKAREKEGLFLFEGIRLADAALVSEARIRFWVVRESAWSKGTLRPLAKRITQPVFVAEDSIFDELSDVETDQGILGVSELTRTSAEDLTPGRILVLDEIRDPGNAGTLIRSAAWFGVPSILFGPGTVDPFSPKVVRSSMGALFGTRLVWSDNLAQSVESLKSRGYRICAADMTGTDYKTWDPDAKTVLVLGNEAHGISSELSATVDFRLTIPGSGNPAAESLNAAIAGSILMAHWTGSGAV